MRRVGSIPHDPDATEVGSLHDLTASPSAAALAESGRAASSAFLKLVVTGDREAVAAALAARPEAACDTDYYGNTALHIACAHKNLPVVQLLLASPGTELDAQEGVHRRSAAHIAASSGASDVLAALVARGAQLELRNAQGETPAHKAAKHARFDCLELLIASGARLDEQDELGRTPLMRACETGSLECAKLLVVAHVKLDMLDSCGRSALHVCALRGKLLCLRTLLQNGADPFRVDGSGRDAAQLARSVGSEDCAAEVERFVASLKTRGRRTRGGGSSAKIEDWSVNECVEWAQDEALGSSVCDAFKAHDVCGSVLLGVTDAVLRDEMRVSSWGARKKATDAVERLRARWKEEQEALKQVPGLGRAGEGSKVIVYTELVMGELLGVGNFGEVKRANWRGTDVAVKVIYRKTLFHDKDHRQMFQQEVDIISQLHHPNIVQFIGTCQSVPEGHFCLVTEFCGGGSLRQLIAENSAALLRDNLRVRIARDVCRAMVHLHKWKPPILHRDLTSSNLLLDHALTCKLADFGLSRESFRDRTLTGGFGAVAWMDPVVLKGGLYVTASDVYSFGMCCFEMVAMQVPHFGVTPLRFAEMVSRGHRPRIPASAPPDWNTLITQCWSSDPSHRPTFEELLRRIENMPAPSEAGSTEAAPAAAAPTANHRPSSIEMALGAAGPDGYING